MFDFPVPCESCGDEADCTTASAQTEEICDDLIYLSTG